MFYTAANTSPAEMLLIMCTNYQTIHTFQHRRLLLEPSSKTAKCFQGPTFTLTVCSAHLNDLTM